MLINIESVVETGIQTKKELNERCTFVKADGKVESNQPVDYIFREDATGVHFKLTVIKGWGDYSGGVDDKYEFPYTAEQISNRVVQKKTIQVTREETIYE